MEHWNGIKFSLNLFKLLRYAVFWVTTDCFSQSCFLLLEIETNIREGSTRIILGVEKKNTGEINAVIFD